MTETFKRLYKCMIEELKNELDSANAVYADMAEKVVAALHNGNELSPGEFERLADNLRQVLARVVNNMNLLCPGQVQVFPVPENAGILETMEVFSCQLDALAETLQKLSGKYTGKKAAAEEEKSRTENSALLPVESSPKIPKVNILVCGGFNAGKTALIQAVTHPGTVPEDNIGYDVETDDKYTVYSTEIANFVEVRDLPEDTVDMEDFTGKILQQISRNHAEKIDRFHAVWYCQDGNGVIWGAAERIISGGGSNKIAVATKLDLLDSEAVETLMSDLLELTGRDNIVFISSVDSTGLETLIEKTLNICRRVLNLSEDEFITFRSAWHDYYCNMFKQWRYIVSDKADSLIHWAAGRAAAIALVPLPLADVAPLIANESYMICKLAGVYGVAIDETVKTMLIGCAGGSLAGKLAASCLPFLKVPIAAGITYGVGKAAKAYFESNMTMNPRELKNTYLAAEQEAKKISWRS